MAGRHTAGTGSTARALLSGRTRTILRIGGTALVLAAVILGVSLFNSGKRPASTLPPITSKPATSSVVPSSTPVAPPAPATTSTSTGTTIPDTTNPGSTTASSSTVLPAGIYASAIANLESVVPASFPGYDMRTVQSDAGEVSVPLQPDGSRQDPVRSALVTITDKRTASAATAFVAGMTKAFDKNVMHATAGSARGLFGTDGTDTAAFRFARGRYVVEVLVTSSSGQPDALKNEVLRLASLMPASRP